MSFQSSTNNARNLLKCRKSNARCDICREFFCNRYVRDFHMNHAHNLQLHYTCYQCEDSPEAEESNIYFKCVYSLHMHNAEDYDHMTRRATFSFEPTSYKFNMFSCLYF